MPVKRRRRRRPAPLRTARAILMDDLDLAEDPFELFIQGREMVAEPDLREAWATHGQKWLAEHVEKWPGNRPSGWWTYSAAEPRRAEMSEDLRAERGEWARWDEGEAGWRAQAGRAFGYGRIGKDDQLHECYDTMDLPTYETQLDYLRRLGLMLPGEAERFDALDEATRQAILADKATQPIPPYGNAQPHVTARKGTSCPHAHDADAGLKLTPA